MSYEIKEYINIFYLYFLAKSINYNKAQQSISSVIDELDKLRNEEAFQELYQILLKFCQENKINLNDKPEHHRKRTIYIRFKDSIIESTIGQRDDNQNQEYYRAYIDYQLIDNILVELNDRFSPKN